MQSRKHIQALRGFSVLAIVIFHANEKILPNGYLGVDIFFVISGFVITPLLLPIFEIFSILDKTQFLLTFLKKRFFRLAPAVAAALTFYTVPIFFLIKIDDHPRTWH